MDSLFLKVKKTGLSKKSQDYGKPELFSFKIEFFPNRRELFHFSVLASQTS